MHGAGGQVGHQGAIDRVSLPLQTCCDRKTKSANRTRNCRSEKSDEQGRVGSRGTPRSSTQRCHSTIERASTHSRYVASLRRLSTVTLEMPCLGLTFAEETDLKSLEKYYEFLREKYSRWETSLSKIYTTKDKQLDLQRIFQRKQSLLDEERERRFLLRNRVRLYNLVMESIRNYARTRVNPSLLDETILKVIYQSSRVSRIRRIDRMNFLADSSFALHLQTNETTRMIWTRKRCTMAKRRFY